MNLLAIGWSDVYMLSNFKIHDNESGKGYSQYFVMGIGPRVAKANEDTDKMAHMAFTPSRDPTQCALLAVITEMILGFACSGEDLGMRTADPEQPQTVANMALNPASRKYKAPGCSLTWTLHFDHDRTGCTSCAWSLVTFNPMHHAPCPIFDRFDFQGPRKPLTHRCRCRGG